MGQYYQIYLDDQPGRPTIIDPAGLDCGMKLTEFSFYLQNKEESTFCGDLVIKSLMTTLKDNGPLRIATVGDYADDVLNGKYGVAPEKFTKEIYGLCWGESRKERPEVELKVDPKSSKYEFYPRGGFLLNMNKREYVDLTKYVKLFNDTKRSWGYHPLPLLTAIGNGQGGGDYHEGLPNSDMVGTWAMDTICLRAVNPTDCTDITEQALFTEA